MGISPKQMQALRDYADGYEMPDICDFCGPGWALAFQNRERVINALKRRGLLNADCQIAQAGRDLVAGCEVNTDEMTEAQFRAFAS